MSTIAKSSGAPAEIRAVGRHTTPLGSFWSEWTTLGLYRIQWHPPVNVAEGGIAADVEKTLEERIGHFDTVLESYFAGCFAELNRVEVDPAGWTPFYREVYRVCRAIPAGQTLTYGELAAQAGRPAAARAVGQAMATNRVMWIIPCHRVVASGGRLHHYGGPGGVEMKRWLLEHERASYAGSVAATRVFTGRR